MKWLIASDLHGSHVYCEKLLECYKQEQAERILLLGDILYHGPRNALPELYDTMKVTAQLNQLAEDIVCVRGNCDAEIDQMVLSFPMRADYTILNAGKHIIFATHGHLYNNLMLPPLHKGDILLHGHTHVPACEEYETHVYLNPGSVSIPKENSPHGYMTFDGEVFRWKTLSGEEYMKYEVKA